MTARDENDGLRLGITRAFAEGWSAKGGDPPPIAFESDDTFLIASIQVPGEVRPLEYAVLKGADAGGYTNFFRDQGVWLERRSRMVKGE